VGLGRGERGDGDGDGAPVSELGCIDVTVYEADLYS